MIEVTLFVSLCVNGFLIYQFFELMKEKPVKGVVTFVTSDDFGKQISFDREFKLIHPMKELPKTILN